MQPPSTPSVVIRTCGIEDAAAIETLRVQTWRVAYEGIVPSSFLRELAPDLDRRRALITERPEDAVELVAAESGRVVGWVAAGQCRDGDQDKTSVGEVYACYVAPSHWGRGVGRQLLHPALAAVERSGRLAVVLWVLRDNARARAFYEAFNFRPDGTQQVLDLHGPVAEVRYLRAAAS